MTILAGEIILADDFGGLTNPWVTWTPTLTNLTLGNGTVTARARLVGKTWDYRFRFDLGSTSAVGTNPRFSLPVTGHASFSAVSDIAGYGTMRDSSVPANRQCEARFVAGRQSLDLYAVDSTGLIATITSTAPWTWATGDSLMVIGTIELV